MFTGRIGEKIFSKISDIAYLSYTKISSWNPIVTVAVSTMMGSFLLILFFNSRKFSKVESCNIESGNKSRDLVAEMANEYRLKALADVVNENEKISSKTLQDYKEFRDEIVKLIDKLEKRTTNVTLQTDINKAEIEELGRILKILSVRLGNLEDKFE